MKRHPIAWQAPEPLWARLGASAASASDQLRPSLLRFATDDFMDQIIGALAHDPRRLGDLVTRPESWRTQFPDVDLAQRAPAPRRVTAAILSRALRSPTKATEVQSAPPPTPLKLYQPAHQRYYLVAATLACRVAGLPDRAVTRPDVERVGFVLRRLLPATPGAATDDVREFAYVKSGEGASWRLCADDAAQLAHDEDLLPLFPLAFADAAARPRKLWAGLVPVARREEYIGAKIDRAPLSLAQGQLQALSATPPAAPARSKMARMMQLKFDVVEPWKSLVRGSFAASEALSESNDDAASKTARAKTLNMQWQMQSWLILLDLADYFAAHVPDVWAAISGAAAATTLPRERRAFYDWLGAVAMSPALAAVMPERPPAASLREALALIPSARGGLESTERLYDKTSVREPAWPAFHFLLAGLDAALHPAGAFEAVGALAADAPAAGEEVPGGAPEASVTAARLEADKLDRFTAAVARLLEPSAEADAPPAPFALQLQKALTATAGDAGSFIVRCVYLNRDCGPLHPPVLSAPTEPFQLASFFDPDAPARPIRITLPSDTTPAGLRKHKKGAAFIMSDLLCGQIQRAKSLGLGDLVRSVLPWPLHKDLDVGGGGACRGGAETNIGMICSLSIPIITICALILLMVMVSLLDLLFRWLPFFMVCLPVPKLKAKS